MNDLKVFLLNVLAAVVRVGMWLLALVLAVFLLAMALMLLLVGLLWALIRGRKPQPAVYVGRFREFTARRGWPGHGHWARPSGETHTEVVEVEVREVRDSGEEPAPHKPGRDI